MTVSLTDIPTPVFQLIADFQSGRLDVHTFSDIKKKVHAIVNLTIVNKQCKQRIERWNTFKELKDMYFLFKKYGQYENEYLDARKNNHHLGFVGAPQLLDAVLSGVSVFRNVRGPQGAKHSYLQYTHETENDIKKIVELLPNSLHCNIGFITVHDDFSGRDSVTHTHLTPLALACCNVSIPKEIVQFLIASKADPKALHMKRVDNDNKAEETMEQLVESITEIGGPEEFDRGTEILEVLQKNIEN